MMTSRERILTALNLGIPDRVPYYESVVEPIFAEALFGEKDADVRRISALFHMDNVPCFCFAPIFAEKRLTSSGREILERGLISSRKDLDRLELPSPDDEGFYDEVKKQVGEICLGK